MNLAIKPNTNPCISSTKKGMIKSFSDMKTNGFCSPSFYLGYKILKKTNAALIRVKSHIMMGDVFRELRLVVSRYDTAKLKPSIASNIAVTCGGFISNLGKTVMPNNIELIRNRAENLTDSQAQKLESVIDIIEPLNDAHTALNRILTFQEETLKVKDGKQIIDTIKQSLEMINHACNLSHACTEEILAGTNA